VDRNQAQPREAQLPPHSLHLFWLQKGGRGTHQVTGRRDTIFVQVNIQEAGMVAYMPPEEPFLALIGNDPISEAVLRRTRTSALLSTEFSYESGERISVKAITCQDTGGMHIRRFFFIGRVSLFLAPDGV
jgi:hypothetical protein